jgi:hypothetical protein
MARSWLMHAEPLMLRVTYVIHSKFKNVKAIIKLTINSQSIAGHG